ALRRRPRVSWLSARWASSSPAEIRARPANMLTMLNSTVQPISPCSSPDGVLPKASVAMWAIPAKGTRVSMEPKAARTAATIRGDRMELRMWLMGPGSLRASVAVSRVVMSVTYPEIQSKRHDFCGVWMSVQVGGGSDPTPSLLIQKPWKSALHYKVLRIIIDNVI